MIPAFDLPTRNHDYVLKFVSEGVARYAASLIQARQENKTSDHWKTVIQSVLYLNRQTDKAANRDKKALKDAAIKELAYDAERFDDRAETWARATGYCSSRDYRKIFGERHSYQVEAALRDADILLHVTAFRNREASYKNHFHVVKDLKDDRSAFEVVIPKELYAKTRTAVADLNRKIRDYNHTFYNPTGFDFSLAIEVGKQHPNPTVAGRLLAWEKNPNNAAYYSTNGTNGHIFAAPSNIHKEIRQLIGFSYNKTKTTLSEVDISAAYPSLLPTTLRALLDRRDEDSGVLVNKLYDSERQPLDRQAIEHDLQLWELLSGEPEGFYKALIRVSATAYTITEVKKAALIFLFDDPSRASKRANSLGWFARLVATVFPDLYKAIRALKTYLKYQHFAHRIQCDGRQIMRSAIDKYIDPSFDQASYNPELPLAFAPIIDCLLVPTPYAQRAHRAIKQTLAELQVFAPVKVTHNKVSQDRINEILATYKQTTEVQETQEGIKTALSYTEGVQEPTEPLEDARLQQAIQRAAVKRKAVEARREAKQKAHSAPKTKTLADYIDLEENQVAIPLFPHRDGNYIIPELYRITKDTQIQSLPVVNHRTNWYYPTGTLTARTTKENWQASPTRVSFQFFLEKTATYWKRNAILNFQKPFGFTAQNHRRYLDMYHADLVSDLAQHPDIKKHKIAPHILAFAVWSQWQVLLSKKDKTRPLPQVRDWIEVYSADNRCQRFYYARKTAQTDADYSAFLRDRARPDANLAGLREHAQLAYWVVESHQAALVTDLVEQHKEQMRVLEVNYSAAHKIPTHRLGEGFRYDLLETPEFLLDSEAQELKDPRQVYKVKTSALKSSIETCTQVLQESTSLRAPELRKANIRNLAKLEESRIQALVSTRKAFVTRDEHETDARETREFENQVRKSIESTKDSDILQAQVKFAQRIENTPAVKTTIKMLDLGNNVLVSADVGVQLPTAGQLAWEEEQESARASKSASKFGKTSDLTSTSRELAESANNGKTWRIDVQAELGKIAELRERLEKMLAFKLSSKSSSRNSRDAKRSAEFGLSSTGCSATRTSCSFVGTDVVLQATQAAQPKKRDEHSIDKSPQALKRPSKTGVIPARAPEPHRNPSPDAQNPDRTPLRASRDAGIALSSAWTRGNRYAF